LITILAATGFTGKLISQELAKRQIEFQIAGRNAEKLIALAKELKLPPHLIQIVDVMQPESYQAALKNSRVLINCAGPFTDLGIGIVRAAAERGVHYLDTTGEQSFIKQVADICHPIAEAQGCALIPACAFEYALGDAGAAFAARGLKECDELNIYYAMEGFGASRGTKKSIINALTSSSYCYRDGKHVLITSAGEQREVDFPAIGKRSLVSFGGGEVISVPKHVRAGSITTFISAGGSPLMLKLALLFLVPAMKTPLRRLAFKIIDGQAEGPNAQERQQSPFTIICEAKAQNKVQKLSIIGRDPYGLTGLIAAETAIRLLDADRDVSGYTSAARAFGAEFIQKITEPSGVEWVQS
jgi:short subunit dehydrogenase-like uncharacterized protein